MIDYQKLELALKHLEIQFANFRNARNRSELTEIDREAIDTLRLIEDFIHDAIGLYQIMAKSPWK